MNNCTVKGTKKIDLSMWHSIKKKLNIKQVLVTTHDPHQRFKEINQARENGLTFKNTIHPPSLYINKYNINSD